jgi:hypothetical protein
VQPTGYNFNTLVITAGASRFASTFAANRTLPPFTGVWDITYLSNLTTNYQGVVRYKMLITGTGVPLNVDFFRTGAGSMQTGQNYVLGSGGTTKQLLPITQHLLHPKPDFQKLYLNTTTNFGKFITRFGINPIISFTSMLHLE